MTRRMPKNGRKDKNHAELKDAWAGLGGSVVDVSGIPGALDLFVGIHGVSRRIEIKSSKRARLTELEKQAIDTWKGGQIDIWVTTDDVIKTRNEMLEQHKKLHKESLPF